jgi:hypothetical protein
VIVDYATTHDPDQLDVARAIAAKHLSLWTPFARIHLLMKDAGIMSVERVQELKTTCAEFIKQYFELLEETNKCPKLHFIEYHVAEWAERFTSLGLFAEDASESIHALINRMLLRLQAAKGVTKYKCLINKLYEKQDTNLRADIVKIRQRRARKGKSFSPANLKKVHKKT